MEVIHTCPDVRYWSEVLCCTIPTHMSVFEVKVTDLEKNHVKKCDSGELCCPVAALIINFAEIISIKFFSV